VIAIGHDPPETTLPVDDEDVELGFCVGDWRLEVDEFVSLELEVEVVEDDVVLVSDDPDEVVEFELEFVLEDELEWASSAAAIENAAVSTTAPVAIQRFARETRPRPRPRLAGDDSDARVMPFILDGGGERPRRSASEFSYARALTRTASGRAAAASACRSGASCRWPRRATGRCARRRGRARCRSCT
jgi:hypothetical protein